MMPTSDQYHSRVPSRLVMRDRYQLAIRRRGGAPAKNWYFAKIGSYQKSEFTAKISDCWYRTAIDRTATVPDAQYICKLCGITRKRVALAARGCLGTCAGSFV